ncbi:hypothetical protein D3C72_1468760 [compost metagenome]
MGGKPHALYFLAHLGRRLEQARMEVDEDAGAGTVEPAGVENMDRAQDAVDIFDVFRRDQREKFARRHRLAIAVGTHKTLEGIDVEHPAHRAAENGLQCRFQVKGAIGRGPCAIDLADKTGKDAFERHFSTSYRDTTSRLANVAYQALLPG